MTPAEHITTEMCGGCGNSDPAQRCIGCLHDFAREAAPDYTNPETLHIHLRGCQSRTDEYGMINVPAGYVAGAISILTELQHRREAEAGTPDGWSQKAAIEQALERLWDRQVAGEQPSYPETLEAISNALAASPSPPASALEALRSIAVGKMTASDAAYVARTTLSALGEQP